MNLTMMSSVDTKVHFWLQWKIPFSDSIDNIVFFSKIPDISRQWATITYQ